MSNDHFAGKDAIGHVAAAQAEGIIASTEIHGTEAPGSISAGADALRETAFILLLLAAILQLRGFSPLTAFPLLIVFAVGWLAWKAGRAALLGWTRLERLHRILAEERWEIEHNRAQEREELKALYAAKGFEGKLLEEVLDVLMADGDRLLKVMVEEELGLTLEAYEHPLKQALGAAAGVFIAATTCLAFHLLWPFWGLYVTAFFLIAASAIVFAAFQKNRFIPTVIWNLAVAALSIGAAIFIFDFLVQQGWTP